jgi:hypothetical protein
LCQKHACGFSHFLFQRLPFVEKRAINRAVRKPQFPNRVGNSFNIKTAEFAAILRQIRQTCERTGRLSNKSNMHKGTRMKRKYILTFGIPARTETVLCASVRRNTPPPPPNCNNVLIFAIPKNFHFPLFSHNRSNCRDLSMSPGSRETAKNNFVRRYSK